MTWNLASPDFSVLLSFNVDSQNGALNGTLSFNGTMYPVSGAWAASGVTGRTASAFSVFGSTQAASPNFVAASGIMIGGGDAPTQIDIRLGVSSSTDGSLTHYSGVLVPSIVDLQAPGTEPYLSGEINALQKLTATTPVAATIFNNSIVVFTDNNLSTFDLKKLVKSGTDPSDAEAINSDALALSSNWVQSPDFSTLLANNWHPDNLSRCALASTPGAMYFFFNGRNNNDSQAFVAYRFAIDQEEDQTPILLFKDQSQQLLPTEIKFGPRGDISTTVFNDNIIFFACSQALIEGDSSGEAYNTFLGVYDTRNVKVNNAGSTWAASWYSYLKSDLMPPSTISIEWFSTLDQDGQPAFYLAIIGSFSPDGPTSIVWYIPFTVTTDANGGTVVVLSEPPMGRQMNHQPGEADFIETLVRDPSGRVRGWGRPSDKQPGPGLLRGHILDTLEPPPLDGFVGCPRVRERMAASDTLTPPASLFYVFTPGATDTTFNNKKATDYPVYEFIFYGNKPTFQVNRYGTIQVVSGTDSQKLPPTPKYVIGGIIDGPIPLPIENYKDFPLSSPEFTAATLNYGASDTDIKSREVSNKRTAGFKSSGKTTKGVGVAWDISLDAGMGSLKGNSEQQTLSYGLTQPATVTAQTASTPASINPNGTLRLCGAQFGLGAYRFLDMFGQPVSDATNADRGQSVKVASILPSLSDSGVGSFLPYAVNPGDLTSYTPEAINKTMQALSKKVKTPGYSGDNYYGDIICANAYPFTPDQPYLSFSWSEGSHSQQGFSQFKSSYNENSYTFEHSEYAGISEGFGFDLFGLGVEQEAEFLGGATYSHESTESENKESEWGISLGDEWGPPRRSELPESVAAYEFRLFFLPVPKSPSTLNSSFWIQELATYLTAGSDIQVSNIDPGSSCWRIVFVVTKIQYRNGLNPYVYANDHLDKPSVYADGNLRRG